MDTPSTRQRLSQGDWARLQTYLDRFEQAWEAMPSRADTVDLSAWLPPRDDPLRRAALDEMVKTELEIRWRRGEDECLEAYLERLPELGGARTVSAALIYEEFRVRQRYGDRIPLEAYRERFPEQFAELEQMVCAYPVLPRTVTPLVATAHPCNNHDLTEREILPLRTGYRLVRRLQSGGFGEVWRGEAPGGVEVALKIIFGSVDDKQARRELEALELIKRLRHAFLLPLHAFWSFEDRLIIAMELADGSLRDRAATWVQAGQPGLPLAELHQYMREAAEALDYLHAKQVLHRDIKPENVLFLEGHAKVADFDLARLVGQTRRVTTASLCGTMAYTAPEVFWSGKVGPGSDQYSLAVTYAELRLHRPLFPSKNLSQLMIDHLQRVPDLSPLPDAEQRVLRRALAKDADLRFRSCGEFFQALQKSLPAGL